MLKRISAMALLSLCTFFIPPTLQAAGRNSFPPSCRNRPAPPCKVCDRSWFNAEYLYWQTKDSPQPVPLVVEGPLPSSNVVLGGKDIKNDWRSGGKLGLGYWFDNSHMLGGEINYSFFPEITKKSRVSSDGSPGSAVLAAPYFNVYTGLNDFDTIAVPGDFEGTASLQSTSCMQGAEVNVLACIPEDCGVNLVLLAGLRYWSYYEQLTFRTSSPFIPPQVVDVYKTSDNFDGRNNFYGGQVGAKIEFKNNQFFVSALGKVAIGTMHQRLAIKGHLKTNDFSGFGPVEKFTGGYFALPSNIGEHSRDVLATIPEGKISFGIVTDVYRAEVGYSFLYVNNVLWAGNMISNKLNPTQSVTSTENPGTVLVGPKEPKAQFKSSKFWAHGLNVSLEISF